MRTITGRDLKLLCFEEELAPFSNVGILQALVESVIGAHQILARDVDSLRLALDSTDRTPDAILIHDPSTPDYIDELSHAFRRGASHREREMPSFRILQTLKDIENPPPVVVMGAQPNLKAALLRHGAKCVVTSTDGAYFETLTSALKSALDVDHIETRVRPARTSRTTVLDPYKGRVVRGLFGHEGGFRRAAP